MANFDDLSLAVASFGARNAVKFDDMGMPSIMVAVPKMKYSDIITGGTQEVLPWWIVDGVEKDNIWVSKYINSVMNSRAYSLPFKDPANYVNFDTALTYCRNKGAGWHLNQNGVFATLALRAYKNGTPPHGNTNYGASYYQAWEKGVASSKDGSNNTQRTATGSGPVTWYDDFTPAGIADLNGNCWEWCSGMRLVDGEIQIIPYGNAMKSDCNMTASSTEWKAIMPDGTLVAPGTAGTLKYNASAASGGVPQLATAITTSTTDVTDCSTPIKSLAALAGVTIPQILVAAGLYPDSGIATYSGDRIYLRNNGERLPLRGSSFGITSNSGVAAVHLNFPRSLADYGVSFRSALVE